MVAFGITDSLLTNAARGFNRKFQAGDFMALMEYANFMDENPLRGLEIPGLMWFMNLTDTYDGSLRGQMIQAARR